jgi:hypothetical protein
MMIAKVLAVYKTAPIVLVVEPAEALCVSCPSGTCARRAIG